MNSALWFDFGDTVLELSRCEPAAGTAAVLERLLGRLPGREMLEEAVARQQSLEQYFEQRSDISWLEYDLRSFHRLLYVPLVGEYGSELDNELMKIYWDTAFSFRAQPGIHELLDWMELGGRRAGIISNVVFPAWMIERELKRHGLDGRFAPIVASLEYGLRKPSPELFDAARRLLPGDDPLFFGNSIKCDVRGALSAGWRAAWYNRGGVSQAVCPPSAYEIHSWGEVPEVMQ